MYGKWDKSSAKCPGTSIRDDKKGGGGATGAEEGPSYTAAIYRMAGGRGAQRGAKLCSKVKAERAARIERLKHLEAVMTRRVEELLWEHARRAARL